MNNVRWVVGESFESSECHPEILQISKLISDVRQGTYDQMPAIHLRVGQGVARAEWEMLGDLIATRGLIDRVSLGEPPSEPLARQSVLKHDQRNVLISSPRRLPDGRYESDLVIPDHSEMMLDHTADQQHVPGMLLIEAAIQMVTATVTDFVPVIAGQPDPYAVMHGCEFKFERFVFPLPATVILQILQTGDVSEDLTPLTADAEFIQSGRVTSSAHIDLHAFAPSTIFYIENAQACRMLAGISQPAVRTERWISQVNSASMDAVH
jgi:hypothetical protein